MEKDGGFAILQENVRDYIVVEIEHSFVPLFILQIQSGAGASRLKSSATRPHHTSKPLCPAPGVSRSEGDVVARWLRLWPTLGCGDEI